MLTTGAVMCHQTLYFGTFKERPAPVNEGFLSDFIRYLAPAVMHCTTAKHRCVRAAKRVGLTREFRVGVGYESSMGLRFSMRAGLRVGFALPLTS